MARVIGVGGVFFRSGNPDRLYAWYEKHLGLRRSRGRGVVFPWRQAGCEQKEQMTVWSLFPKDTDYFDPANPAFMVNYIVDDLDGIVADLRAAGAQVEDRQEEYEYGRFAWVTDPEGNRIELWQPPHRPA
jgi:predicted enzyme related to lactoylglutathione lyase